MIKTQFNTGNYNEFEKLIKERLPEVLVLIRKTIIPKLDEVLESMLGQNAEIEKNSVNISQIIENKAVVSIDCSLEYDVKDFKVITAPKEAVEEDINAIKQSLENEEYTIKEFTINTSSGILSITFNIPLEKKEND